MEGNAKPGHGPGLEDFQIGGTSFSDIMMQLWDAFPVSFNNCSTYFACYYNLSGICNSSHKNWLLLEQDSNDQHA